jgi:hypothetical protein
MKRLAIKTITWYAIVALFVACAILPMLKAAAPQYFPGGPEGFLDAKRDYGCEYGKVCPEGHFCSQNQCHPIASRYGNAVPEGNGF